MTAAQERRNRHNVYTLSGALLASFAIVLVVVLLTVRPEPSSRNEINWHDVHASAPNASALVDPLFTAADGDWWSNRAEYIAGKTPEWYIGFITPDGGYVAVEQFVDSIDDTVGNVLDDVAGTDITIDGIVWTKFDRSGLDDPGNHALVYQTPLPSGGSLIVSGTASAKEIELVASRAFTSLKG